LPTSQFVVALCDMGLSSRSSLANNAVAAMGDMLHCCPGAMGETYSLIADNFMENSKKNKPKVQRDRVEAVLQEVTESKSEDAALDEAWTSVVIGLVPAMLAKKNAVHLDVSVMTAAFAFVERAVKRLVDRGRIPGLDEGPLAALLSGLALGCVSKSADAKASTKRACNAINDALVKSGSDFKALVVGIPK
jgi:AcrR family transcriptional regulator